jgi:hypothetical protein
MCHGVDKDAQFRSDGILIGEVLGDNGEDGLTVNTTS